MILVASLFAPVERLADWAVTALGLSSDSALGLALSFFLYEMVKVSVLILAISWAMALVRRALPVEAVRTWLQTPTGRVLGYPSAAAFGALTPFCSCSSVPLFIGFIEARLPMGIALAFLITSPLVNEIVVALFIASFGWKVTLIYVAAGLTLGVVGGWILQRLHAERWLTAFARRHYGKEESADACCGCAPEPEPTEPACCEEEAATTCCGEAEPSDEPCGCAASDDGKAEPGPIVFANREARDIYVGVLPYLALALLLGAGIHGFVPEQALAVWFATERWWDIPAAVLMGFPLYASASATVPVLETLVAKGVPLGTGMAFIMSAVGVSVPELIILKRVMTGRLLLAFSLTVGVGVCLIGFLFNTLNF